MKTIADVIGKMATNGQGENSPPNRVSTPSPAKPSIYPETCPECGGVGFVRLDVPVGDPAFGKPVPCDHPCHRDERLAKAAKVSGLAEADMSRRLADIKPDKKGGNLEMIEAARAMIANPFGWLYIWGGPGNAKSEVLYAIVNELNQAGKGPAVYAKLSQLIDHMRDSFSENKHRDKHGPDAADLGYIARFERLKAVKVLAIDEMDKVRSTPFADEFRFEFLDERYRQALRGETVTIFASNTNPADLENEAIYDRIRDGRFKVVHNKAASARPFMKR